MAKTIDADLVRHIGKLSRIELTEGQVRTVARQLTENLGYVHKPQELDTQNDERIAAAVGRRNGFAASYVAILVGPGAGIG